MGSRRSTCRRQRRRRPGGSGYVCCEAEQICLPAGEICATAFTWPPPDVTVGPPPLPLRDSIVFAMSQMPNEGRDPQVLDLAPDMVVRGWSTWDREGLT